MSSLTVITNGRPRDVLRFHELTPNEQSQFDAAGQAKFTPNQSTKT